MLTYYHDSLPEEAACFKSGSLPGHEASSWKQVSCVRCSAQDTPEHFQLLTHTGVYLCRSGAARSRMIPSYCICLQWSHVTGQVVLCTYSGSMVRLYSDVIGGHSNKNYGCRQTHIRPLSKSMRTHGSAKNWPGVSDPAGLNVWKSDMDFR